MKNSSVSTWKSIKGKLKVVSGKTKLRTLIRRVVENKWWFKIIVAEIEEYERGPENNRIIHSDKDLISIENKLVLMSNPAHRTEEELKKITERIAFTKPFSKYPIEMTQKLLKDAALKGFEAGRVLFKANDDPLFAYFILSGVVEVDPFQGNEPVLEFDKRIIKDKETVEGKLTARNQILERGNMIGRREILFGERRSRNALVKEDLLCIRFSHKIMLVTLESMLASWAAVSRYLVKFPILESLNLDDMRELSKLGRIREVKTNKLVEVHDTCNFLVDGEVVIIQRLLVEEYKSNGKEFYRLYHNQDAREYDRSVESIFMQVCVLTNGGFFGLGERMSQYNFWTRRLCKFVQYPMSELMEYGEKLVWDKARIFLDKMYPTTEELFKHYLYGRQVSAYKREVREQCPKSKRPCTIHDAPATLRSQRMKMKRSFIERAGMLNMEEYLTGGLSPLDDEMSYDFVLDKNGDKREKLFGKLLEGSSRSEDVFVG